MHKDVIQARHAQVALETHSRFLAAAAGFNGDKGGHLTKFLERLSEVDQAGPEKRPVSLAEIIAMGHAVAAEQANEDEFARAEREAEEKLALDLFAKHRAKSVPKMA